MPLSETRLRALKPRNKAYKVADERGLYLEVTPAGGKLWRFRYRADGSEKKPPGKMKVRRGHAVPLSRQVVELLEELGELMGRDGYVFPSARSARRPMSENALDAAFRRMGYSKEEVTAHGLRSTASTLLNESGLWSADAIERALAHGDSNVVRGIYHRGKHWDERVRMAQWWSDYLDQLKADRQVAQLKTGT